jgi:hypothetical protein
MKSAARPLALVLRGPTESGFKLAKECAMCGFDLLWAGDLRNVDSAAQQLRSMGAAIELVIADLDTVQGNERLIAAIDGRHVDVRLSYASKWAGGRIGKSDPNESDRPGARD